jgi:hypothetical protein
MQWPMVLRGLWSQRWVVLAVLGVQLVLAATLPLTYDEAYTMAHFVEPGPVVAWLFFPNTNNHVVFSVLASMGALVLPVPEAWVLRGLACLCSACTFGVYAALLSRVGLRRQTVWLMITVLLCTYGHLSQGFQGRGYALAELCFAVSLYAVVRCSILNVAEPLTPARWRGWFATVVLATVAGGCTLVSYAYCAFCVWGWWLAWELRSGLRLRVVTQIVGGSGSALLLVGLFYTPVVLVNGLAALTANPNIELQRVSADAAHNLAFVGYALNWLLFGHTVWSLPIFMVLVLMPGLWIWWRLPVYRAWVLLAVWVVACPWIFALGHGVWPFGRLLGWCLVGLLLPFALWVDRLPHFWAFVLTLAYAGFECYFAQGRYADDFKHDKRSHQAFEQYAGCVQSAAVFDAYYWTWRYRTRTQPGRPTILPLETLLPHQLPQLLIAPLGYDLPPVRAALYKPVSSDEFCRIWIRDDAPLCAGASPAGHTPEPPVDTLTK